MPAIVIAGLVRSTIGNQTDMWLSKCTSVQISNTLKVCVQNVLQVLECKLEDVDTTAWPLHWWTGVGNVLTLDQVRLQRVNVTIRLSTHAPAAYPKSCSLPGWGQDFWLFTELEWWSLVLELTAARSHSDCVNTVSLPYEWLQYRM